MGDRLRAGIPSRAVTSQLGQLSLASLRGRLIESSFGWGEGGNITSAGWQVILCDPIWHVSSRSGEASRELLYSVYLYLYLCLHTAQLMPQPLTVSCFSKIQIGFTFLVPADPGSPGQRAVKRVCVYYCTGR